MNVFRSCRWVSPFLKWMAFAVLLMGAWYAGSLWAPPARTGRRSSVAALCRRKIAPLIQDFYNQRLSVQPAVNEGFYSFAKSSLPESLLLPSEVSSAEQRFGIYFDLPLSLTNDDIRVIMYTDPIPEKGRFAAFATGKGLLCGWLPHGLVEGLKNSERKPDLYVNEADRSSGP